MPKDLMLTEWKFVHSWMLDVSGPFFDFFLEVMIIFYLPLWGSIAYQYIFIPRLDKVVIHVTSKRIWGTTTWSTSARADGIPSRGRRNSRWSLSTSPPSPHIHEHSAATASGLRQTRWTESSSHG